MDRPPGTPGFGKNLATTIFFIFLPNCTIWPMAIQRLRLYLEFENNWFWNLMALGLKCLQIELKAEDENENNYSNLSTLSKLVLESNIWVWWKGWADQQRKETNKLSSFWTTSFVPRNSTATHFRFSFWTGLSLEVFLQIRDLEIIST